MKIYTIIIVAFILIKLLTGVSAMANENYEKATFAGGCFWCMVPPYEIKGVKEIKAGYTGGNVPNPTYEQVTTGKTGHYEAVQIVYDPKEVTYEELLEIFWKNIDPTDGGGQFADRGSQYKTAIFYHNDTQKKLAEESKKRLEQSKKFSKPIVTEILPAKEFYVAEDYHQDYHRKNPIHYNLYKRGSGRYDFIKKTWSDGEKISDVTMNKKKYQKPPVEEIKKRLTPLQYKVTQENGTEPPFNNQYWNNKEDGIYVDIVSGEPLFSSKDKFDSGTGWPSFTKPLERDNIVEKKDFSHGMIRTEVRSKYGDSHLGHVFDDGPPPTGMRYCINSAALRFIPYKDLEKEGYGEYKKLFE